MFRNKKTQMVVTDLFIALFVAGILIAIIIFSWNRYSLMLSEEADYRFMQITAFQTADLLVKSSGEPLDWEDDPRNVDVIGLADKDRELAIDKVDAFVNLSYNRTSKVLGLEIYDFYFQLKYLNGTKLVGYGRTPSNTVVNIQRLVFYKDEKTIFEFALWK